MKILLFPIVLLSGFLAYQMVLIGARNAKADSPRFLAIVFALLVTLTMLQLDAITLGFILIPYAALGITLFLFWSFRWLMKLGLLKMIQGLLAELTERSRRKTSPPPSRSGNSPSTGSPLRKPSKPQD